jgi:hypothetical protein
VGSSVGNSVRSTMEVWDVGSVDLLKEERKYLVVFVQDILGGIVNMHPAVVLGSLMLLIILNWF